MPPNTHKTSSSNHKLYHQALRFTNLYVCLGLAYGTLLVGAALHVSGAPLGLLLGLQDAPPVGEMHAGGGSVEGGWVKSGALSLVTAGVMGILVGFMVRQQQMYHTYVHRFIRYRVLLRAPAGLLAFRRTFTLSCNCSRWKVALLICSAAAAFWP